MSGFRRSTGTAPIPCRVTPLVPYLYTAAMGPFFLVLKETSHTYLQYRYHALPGQAAQTRNGPISWDNVGVKHTHTHAWLSRLQPRYGHIAKTLVGKQFYKPLVIIYLECCSCRTYAVFRTACCHPPCLLHICIYYHPPSRLPGWNRGARFIRGYGVDQPSEDHPQTMIFCAKLSSPTALYKLRYDKKSESALALS